jgi:NADPH:quinone reductase-like Zn-dependent oxidoreductase
MSSSRALVCRPSNGKNRLSLESVPLPSIQPHQVLVRTKTVAQNPTDVKSFDDNNMGDGAVLGCDFCGRVEQLGADVTRVQVGDRIAGLIFPGEKKGVGAYAEHTVADEKICFKVPEPMSSEAAATIPLALATAWLAMLSSHSLGMDRSKGDANQLLIWGGSSSVGQYAIQIAKYFGFQFATTCTNSEIVKDYLGVSKRVFNYRSPTVVEDIKKSLPAITYVFDCIGTETSSVQASKTVSDAGGVLVTVRPGKAFTENIEPRVRATDVIVWTAFFKEIKYRGLHYPVSFMLIWLWCLATDYPIA